MRCSKGVSSALEKKVKHTRIKMNRKRPRISLKVLEAVKEHFPDTKNFIDNMLEEQCQEEKISVEEVIFYKSKSKKLTQKTSFVLQ